MHKKTAAPLIARVAVFLCLFVLLSGIIGPRIIGSNVLYDGYFWIYGSLGKALLFAGAAFTLLAYRMPPPTLHQWHPRLAMWGGLGIAAYVGAWLGVSQLMQHIDTLWILATHVLLLGSVVAAGLACFGRANLRLLAYSYRRALGLAAAASAGFYVLLTVFYRSWELLASTVLHSVRWLLDITGLHTAVVPPHTLLLDRFGVTIAQSCSGVESLALFTGLYIVVGLLDRHKLHLARYLWIFPLALGGLFACNILRVYALIVAGYYIDPEITFTLFHTYAGMVFFIIYAALFFRFGYRWLLRQHREATAHPAQMARH